MAAEFLTATSFAPLPASRQFPQAVLKCGDEILYDGIYGETSNPGSTSCRSI
jgi:hypothetical protein